LRLGLILVAASLLALQWVSNLDATFGSSSILTNALRDVKYGCAPCAQPTVQAGEGMSGEGPPPDRAVVPLFAGHPSRIACVAASDPPVWTGESTES
jgi:hypothetical protein